MGLGITKSNRSIRYEMPFFSGRDLSREDNTWIVEHLRQLADEIEESDTRIISVSIRSRLIRLICLKFIT